MTGLIFGLAPALQAGRLNLQEALRDGARGSGQSGKRARLRNGLVIVEVAMALVLLVGASLFVRSFLNLQSASPGFDTKPLLTARFFMSGESYATDDLKAQRVEDVARRIEALPGVDKRVRVELRAARCRRRQRSCHCRRPHVPARRRADDPFHRRHPSHLQDDGHDRS